MMYRIDAAKNYLEQDEDQKAKEQLVKIAALPKEDEDDDAVRAEAKTMLEKMK